MPRAFCRYAKENKREVMQMIILDLEWNRSYDKKPLDEILQIGAVRVEEIGGPIVDTFSVFVRPTVHKRFDPGAKKLPELQASVQSTVEFPAALERFRAWCGGETAFAAWGGGDDFKALRQNCEYWNIPPVPVETVCDLQTAFSYLVGAGQQVALWRAAEYCGVPDIFDFHNALCDAMYTAVVARWITPEALAYRPERREKSRRLPSPRLSKLPFPKQRSERQNGAAAGLPSLRAAGFCQPVELCAGQGRGGAAGLLRSIPLSGTRALFVPHDAEPAGGWNLGGTAVCSGRHAGAGAGV